MKMNLTGSYQTDVGRVRTHNEDAVQILQNEHVLLMVVADGMGGHSAGDVAAKMALDAVNEKFNPELTFSDEAAVVAWFSDVLHRVNGDILAYARKHQVKKMGTTLVAAMVTPDFVTIVNIGDSRAYLVAYNKLRQITTDHTFVRRLVEEGQISERAAKMHPQKNLIINALGANKILDYDVLTIEHVDLQQILLCTDGLTGMVEDKDIFDVIQRDESVEKKVANLIELANSEGGKDNVSVALIEFEERSLAK
ncbi:MAG: Stp1/IreP family PP2C-type Ser/Thr phosphatase [Turicibacter sp.]|nr:Stp1/IreP family PP2C-type Ser/Thr phosphatase [Turicibacter sp.]